jgi:hypothetical protein
MLSSPSLPTISLRTNLHSLHGQIANATNAAHLRNALQQYIALAQQLGSALPGNDAKLVGGLIPGGAVVSAAVSSVSRLGSHSGSGAVGAA